MSSLRRKPQAFRDGGAVDVDVAAPQGAEEAASVLKAQIAAMERAQAEEAARNQHDTASPTEKVQESRRLQWLASNPLAAQHGDKLNELHHQALQSGLADTSPDYFHWMDDQLAALASRRPSAEHIIRDMESRIADAARQQPEPKPESEHMANGAHVSAPVSREIPSSGGRRIGGTINLSPQQREAAKLAGVSEKVYAEQLQRLHEFKERGDYV